MNYIQKNATSFFFSFLIVLLVVASVVSFKGIKQLSFTAEQVNHSTVVKNNLVELLSLIKDAEAGQRGYLLTSDSSFLEPIIGIYDKINPVFKVLDSLLLDNPSQVFQLQKLKNLIRERIIFSNNTLQLWQQKQTTSRIDSALMKGKRKMDLLKKESEIMIRNENELLQIRTKRNAWNVWFTPFFALFTSLISIIFISVAFVKAKEENVLRREANEALKNKNYDLKQQQDFVDALFDASVDVMSVLDKNLIFQKFNNAGVKVYGRSKDELIGNNFLELYPHIKETGLYDDLLKALTGEMVHKSTYFSPPTQKHLELFLIPLRNRQNEVESVLMIAHDVTSIVENNQQLYLQNQQLEQTNQELASFSYIASHDLKEPLRKIQVFTNRILETETFTDKTQDYFTRILSATKRMQNLIDSLLDFSQANSNSLSFETCNLNEILHEVKNNLEESVRESQAVIHADHLPTIDGLSIQLTQLFTNLIENALKYRKKEILLKVLISYSIEDGNRIDVPIADQQKKYHSICFSDNGIGFEQQYANKIFDIFQRLHARHEYTGTGIGLAICKKIVSNHNGYIAALGIPGDGANFHIYFPI